MHRPTYVVARFPLVGGQSLPERWRASFAVHESHHPPTTQHLLSSTSRAVFSFDVSIASTGITRIRCAALSHSPTSTANPAPPTTLQSSLLIYTCTAGRRLPDSGRGLRPGNTPLETLIKSTWRMLLLKQRHLSPPAKMTLMAREYDPSPRSRRSRALSHREPPCAGG